MGKPPENTGLLRAVRAAKYSAQGFAHAWRRESAFRQEMVLFVIMAPTALWLGRSPVEKGLLVFVLVLVLVIELLNSAIEATVDRFGGETHELSGIAKDLGSAAVSLALIMVWLIWGTVIYSRFFSDQGAPIL